MVTKEAGDFSRSHSVEIRGHLNLAGEEADALLRCRFRGINCHYLDQWLTRLSDDEWLAIILGAQQERLSFFNLV